MFGLGEIKKVLKGALNSQRETILNIFWRGLQVVGKQGIIFFIFILCTHLLAPADLGAYTYVLATMSLLVLFGDFGISTATSKFVSEYHQKDKEKVKAVLANALYVLTIFSFVITCFVIFFGKYFFGDRYYLVLYALPLIFLVPVSSIYDGVYRGFKRFRGLAIISFVAAIASLPLIYFATRWYGVAGALAAQSIFYAFNTLSLAIGYRESISMRLSREVIKEVSSYSLYVGLATLGYYLFSRVDILILGHFGYFEQIANYELLNKLFGVCLLVFEIIAQVVAPNFTRLYARGEYATILEKFKKYILIFSICSVVFLVLSLYGVPIVISIFFRGYTNSILSKILFPVTLFYALSIYGAVINAGIIVPTGYARLMTFLNLLLAICNAGLAWVLHGAYGYIGVIYATLISNFVGTFALQFVFYKKFKSTNNGQ